MTENEGKAGIAIVYSTPTCPYCTMIKGYLESKGVKYQEYDVSVDKQRAREMIGKSGQMGVPVTDINGRIIVGFDRVAIDEALSGKRIDSSAKKGNILFDLFSR
jgi:glutaredoxin 3